MGHGNASTLDDNDHRRFGGQCGWLKHKRSIFSPGMRRRRSNILVVGMTQCRHMVPNHQNKFVPQPGQRTTLQPTAGTAQQLKWII
jgi:hypothetical protein